MSIAITKVVWVDETLFKKMFFRYWLIIYPPFGMYNLIDVQGGQSAITKNFTHSPCRNHTNYCKTTTF